MSKERPILFSGDMVRAILDNRKKQTRRIVKARKLHPDYGEPQWDEAFIDGTPPEPYLHVPFAGIAIDRTVHRHYPPYEVGDRLWVKETHNIGYNLSEDKCGPRKFAVNYKADNTWRDKQLTQEEYDKWLRRKKRFGPCSAIFMYKSLTRIWLEITNIRVERVQDIGEAGAVAEGVEHYETAGLKGWKPYKYFTKNTVEYQARRASTVCKTARDSFISLWDSLNAKRGYGWSDEDLPDNLKTGKGRVMYGNPWVWVIEFKRIDK